jgi:hypothetical protein
MKVFLLIAVVTLAAPAFAETTPPAPPSPSAPVSKDKTDFTKPFVYDRLAQQAPPGPSAPRPHVEITAGPGAR